MSTFPPLPIPHVGGQQRRPRSHYPLSRGWQKAAPQCQRVQLSAYKKLYPAPKDSSSPHSLSSHNYAKAFLPLVVLQLKYYSMPPPIVIPRSQARRRLRNCTYRASKKSKPKPSSLSALPVEIITAILEELPDLRTLVSTIKVCRTVYEVYNGSGGRIARTIFTKVCARIRHYRLGEVYWDFAFAINEPWLHRLHVMQMFAEAWPIFLSRQLEELLYPLGMILAWTCGEAVEITLLRRIWDSDKLLPSSPPPQRLPGDPARWQPALIPVGKRLLELTTDEQEQVSIAAEIERLCTLRDDLLMEHAKVIEVNKKTIVLRPGENGGVGKGPIFTMFNAPRLPFGTPRHAWAKPHLAAIRAYKARVAEEWR